MIKEQEVTVGIKSFLRPDAISGTLERLRPFRFANIIVADDGEICREKEKIYRQAHKNLPGFELIRLPRDVGLSAGRNAIVDQCRTKYLLMLDDDQHIPENIMDLGEVLNNDPWLGGVSCYWLENGYFKCTASNIFEAGSYLFTDMDKFQIYTTKSGVQYIYADFIPNSTLFRIQCLKDYRWDEYFKISREHLDFYLAHKRLGIWRFAVAPSVIIEHFPQRHGTYYKKFRKNDSRLKSSDQYFLKKWGKKRVVKATSFQPSKGMRKKLLHLFLKMNIPVLGVKITDNLEILTKKLREKSSSG